MERKALGWLRQSHRPVQTSEVMALGPLRTLSFFVAVTVAMLPLMNA